MPVDIVTGDRDLFQLVDDEAEVRVLYIARGVGRHERVTNAVVREKYGVDADQYAALATLRGDSSDGLPGVAGVGDKTAATLLNRFGGLDAVIAAAVDPDGDMGPGPRGKIKAALDYLAVAPKVVAVAREIDLGKPDLTLPGSPVDPDMVAAIAEQWGLDQSRQAADRGAGPLRHSVGAGREPVDVATVLAVGVVPADGRAREEDAVVGALHGAEEPDPGRGAVEGALGTVRVAVVGPDRAARHGLAWAPRPVAAQLQEERAVAARDEHPVRLDAAVLAVGQHGRAARGAAGSARPGSGDACQGYQQPQGGDGGDQDTSGAGEGRPPRLLGRERISEEG